jgi:hypothetical protein
MAVVAAATCAALAAPMGYAALAAPTGAESPSARPPGIWVEPKDRETVAFAYLHSPTFRAQFDRARAHPAIAVRLSAVPAPWLDGRSVLGLTRWREVPQVLRQGPRVQFHGVIVSRARVGPLREVAARMAHELAHVNELARYGDIRNAPGYRVSGSDRKFAETEPALAIGEQVRAELAAVKLRRLQEFEIAAVLGPTPPNRSDDVLLAEIEEKQGEVAAGSATTLGEEAMNVP